MLAFCPEGKDRLLSEQAAHMAQMPGQKQKVKNTKTNFKLKMKIHMILFSIKLE